MSTSEDAVLRAIGLYGWFTAMRERLVTSMIVEILLSTVLDGHLIGPLVVYELALTGLDAAHKIPFRDTTKSGRSLGCLTKSGFRNSG